MPNGEMDITGNIKMIETYQSQLLRLVADLYASMLEGKVSVKERSDTLAELLITLYLLSDKLGITYTALDNKVLSRLKVNMLEEGVSAEGKRAYLSLCRHIDKLRDLGK